MVRAAREGWHKSATRGLNIKKVQPKKAASKKATPKKAASKKAAPKKAPPKKKGVIKGDPVETILAKMAEMDQIGIKEVNQAILLEATGYARHDSNGYRAAAKKVIKELGYVSRVTKDKKTTYTLTESGRNYLLESGIIVIPEEPKNNEEYHAQLLETLGKLVAAPQMKLKQVFAALSDGDWHSTPELLAESGYGRPDSNGYRNIMSGMKKLDLMEKSGQNIRLSDKAFKFGRPEGN